jgi:GlcNAc-PI de-N-acetylase
MKCQPTAMVGNVFFWTICLCLAIAPNAPAQTDGVLLAQTGASLSNLVYMQVLAHEDDDFLFMNPDIANQIASGVKTVSIYVTAGQSCGVGQCPDYQVPANSDGSCPDGYAADATGACTSILYDSVPPLVLSREEFAAARQSGIRAAYAQMANVPNSWTRSLIQPDGTYTVELYVLSAAPQIQLLFMNLPDGGDIVPWRDYALVNLFADPAYQTDTIVPFCDENTNTVLAKESAAGRNPAGCDEQFNDPPVPQQFYTRAGVVSVLSALVQAYQPIEVRALDPQPFQFGVSFIENCTTPTNLATCQMESVSAVSFDNTDHTVTARFVDEVLANYHGPNGTGRYSLIHYKGYSSPDFPGNLGEADYRSKSNTADTYMPYDPNYVGTMSQAHNEHEGYYPYYHRVWERYPGSTNWLQRAKDGRLVAVNVEDRRVKIWYESVPGGPWIGPVAIWTGAPISPYVTLFQRPDGSLQIFALRLPPEREQPPIPPNAPLQDIITTVQVNSRSGALVEPIAFGPWQSLGSPDAELCASSPVASCEFVGVPTAAVDGSGRMFVFAKNSLGLVSYTYSADGKTWSPWDSASFETQIQPYLGELLIPQDIIDGIAAITGDDGRVEVFATMRVGLGGPTGQLWHFVQDPSSAHFSFDLRLTYLNAASAPTVAKNQNGRLEIFFREPEDSTSLTPGARVLTYFPDVVSGQAVPEILYGDAGAGPVAAIRRESTGEIMLFERNVWNGISELRQASPNNAFAGQSLQWEILGGLLNEYPAAATDRFGRVVVIVKGLDGQLYMRRERLPTASGSFAPWQVVGGFRPQLLP